MRHSSWMDGLGRSARRAVGSQGGLRHMAEVGVLRWWPREWAAPWTLQSSPSLSGHCFDPNLHFSHPDSRHMGRLRAYVWVL